MATPWEDEGSRRQFFATQLPAFTHRMTAKNLGFHRRAIPSHHGPTSLGLIDQGAQFIIGATQIMIFTRIVRGQALGNERLGGRIQGRITRRAPTRFEQRRQIV